MCRSITFQKQTSKQKKNSQEKRSDLWLPEVQSGVQELNENSQKVQTSNYKINKCQGCKVQHDKYN